MKVLFAAATSSPDMAAGFLWDSLQAVLGPDNVADASEGQQYLGTNPDAWTGYDRAIQRGVGLVRRPQKGEDDFDLIVASTSFLRNFSWEWLAQQRERRLKPGGKVVYFDTLDAPTEIYPPPFPVDAVFRREIDPAVQYPYGHKPLVLLCAIPRRWFDDPVYGWTDQKPRDVFNVSNAVSTGDPARWNSLAPTFRTRKKTSSLAGDAVLQPPMLYTALMRQFKLVVCTPGGGCSSDSMRLWETIAVGGIPIFTGQPCRPRWPWFSGEHIFGCDKVEDLPAVIERALEETDLDAMRLRLKQHALLWHTTYERGLQFLKLIEEDAWLSEAPGPWRW